MSFVRSQVIAYRFAAQGLDRRPGGAAGVLDLGVQDTPAGTARQALAVRGVSTVDDTLATVWAARGAPHVHRRSDLVRLSRALWPVSDADATARFVTTVVKDGGKLGRAAFEAAAAAFAEVVTGPTPKGEASTGVSARVPESLTYWCRPCQARHISGSLFSQTALAAGIELLPSTGAAVLGPLPEWPGIPARSEGVGDVIAAYLAVLGPATPSDLAKFLGTKVAELKKVWPDGLAEVTVDGHRAWLPEQRLADLGSSPEPDAVRLLPPSDPWLQARDRDLIVPDPAHQKEVWRILGNPGVLLVGGEVVGTWRAKVSGRRLDVTVTPFGTLRPAVRAAAEAEAALTAQTRGAAEARVTFGS